MQRVMSEDLDLVITDHGMPGMNGLQLASAVRRIDPNKSVILLTGFALGSEQQPKVVDCVLKKPLVREELQGALRRVLGR
jgi:YesN/AraC family two-component response regulator